ncbi:MAG TPA: hypothetical protein ENI86_09160 [Acidimicrobiales bacterium]|nr:hypothetical protein [Acidimicrobiales bacterium]
MTPDGQGVWVTYDDGTVEARGTGTPHYGDKPTLEANEKVVALAPTNGAGYWLFTDRGNVFEYGDAVNYGDVGDLTLNGPVIAAVPTSTGDGYYMLGTDGGIFTFGDAVFRGSLPGIGVVPDLPVVSMSATPGGYLLIAEDGGTFAFGSAGFFGSLPGIGVTPAAPIIDLVPGSAGYLMLGEDGGIFNFGQSNFLGALVGYSSSPAVSVAVKPDLSGYLILTEDAVVWSFGDTRSVGVTKITGTGDSVVDQVVSSRSVIRLTHTGGSSNFAVWALDSTNAKLDLLANDIGASDGWYWLDEPDTTRLEITADGNWTVEIAPTSYARKWRFDNGPISGTGPDVLLIPPVGPKVFSADVDGTGNDVVWHYRGTGTFDKDLLLNEIGQVSDNQKTMQTTSIPSYLGVDVDNDATWTFRIS